MRDDTLVNPAVRQTLRWHETQKIPSRMVVWEIWQSLGSSERANQLSNARLSPLFPSSTGPVKPATGRDFYLRTPADRDILCGSISQWRVGDRVHHGRVPKSLRPLRRFMGQSRPVIQP